MTLNGHGSSLKDDDYLIHVDGDEDDVDEDDTSRVPSSTEYSDMLENDQQEQQPMGNLFRLDEMMGTFPFSHASLFSSSEVHGNEIRKLELECLQLAQVKSSLDNQFLTINEKTKILAHKIQHLLEITSPNRPSTSDANSDDTNTLLATALDSIEQLDGIIIKNLPLFNGDQDLLKKKSDEQENSILKLKQDNHVLIKQCNDTQSLFHKNHDQLVSETSSPVSASASFAFLDGLIRGVGKHP